METRIPSPARSQGAAASPRRLRLRKTRSVGSPSPSTAPGRLSSVVQFYDRNKDSFRLSPMPTRRSVLNDDTDIEEPRRRSWWKKLSNNSRDVMEVLNENKILETNEAIEEYIDIEVLSQEKKNYTLDLPESSDGESISSIVIPQRQLFTQKENLPQKKFGQLIETRETLAKLHKTTNSDKTLHVAPRNLFSQALKTKPKPVFPAALLNISPNKTANKTKEITVADVRGQVHTLFGNKGGTKRKNMFADFIVSDSDEDISEIQPKVFGFQRTDKPQREPSTAYRRDTSPTSSITIDNEMEDWKLLPSSTMVETQLEDMMATGKTPLKRPRLSNLKRASLNKEKFDEETPKEGSEENLEIIKENDEKNLKLNVEKLEVNGENLEINKGNNRVSLETNEVNSEENPKVNKENYAENPEINIEYVEKKQKVFEKTLQIDEENPIVIEEFLQYDDEENLEVNEESLVVSEVNLKVTDRKNLDVNEENDKETTKVNKDNHVVIDRGNLQIDKENLKVNKENLEIIGRENLELEVENDEETPKVNEQNLTINDKENILEINQENDEETTKVNEASLVEDNEENLEINEANDEENPELNENNDVEMLEVNEEDDEENQELNENNDEENLEINEENVEENPELNENNDVEMLEVNVEDDEDNQELNENNDDENLEINEENVEEYPELNENHGKEKLEVNEENNGEDLEINEDNDEEHCEENDDKDREQDEESDNEENHEENQEVNEDWQSDIQEEQEESDLDVLQYEESEVEVQSEPEESIEEEIVDQHEESQHEESQHEREREEEEQSEEENEDSKQESDRDFEEDNQEQEVSREMDSIDNSAEIEDTNENEEQLDDENEDSKQESNGDFEEDNQEQNESREMDSINNSAQIEDDNENEEQLDNGDNEQNVDENVEGIGTLNISHDTTGRYRQKEHSKENSPEVILHDKTKQMESFMPKGRNTSLRRTSIMKSMNIRSSLVPPNESVALSDGTRNSSAEGSGWDSHRTTRKTLRQTFGKDFSPRKSLRTLVIEKSAKRQTAVTDITSISSKLPMGNSTEIPETSNLEDEHIPTETVHNISKRTRQTTLELYLQKIKTQNLERKMKMEEDIRNSLKPPSKDILNPFKVPSKSMFPAKKTNMKQLQSKSKPKKIKSTLVNFDDLPPEMIEDMKYKPPKRFQPGNAAWITKRLYKFLETKLEPKYDYKARIRAEKLVQSVYEFGKDLRRHTVAPSDAVDLLKHEMARLQIVNTHYEFYQFFHDYMPREIRVKVVPDVVNKIPLPRHGIFSEILQGNTIQG